ncbi:MAG: ACT domain-containing protein [Gemmatales bacterium]
MIFQAEWITLEVYSDLSGVGLTAAVSGVLAKAGISCNVVAGYHHDHLFVPAGRGQEAVKLLLELQSRNTVGRRPAARLGSRPTQPLPEP